jgi:hypothetical protein
MKQMAKDATFQFFSGGRHHFQGFGEWVFSLDRSGSLHAEQFVGEQKKYDKIYTLSKDENVKCWACIDALGIPSMKGSDRPGVPDEAQYRLLLVDGSRQVEVKVWANDVQKRPDVKKLVDLVKEILVRYSKKSVVL